MSKITIPLAVPNLKGNEAKYLQECITTTFVSSVGPFVTRFEDMVAKASGSKGAVATSSGTCALHIALLSVGVKPGDLVILPSFTFIASANAIAHCGALPWLFDIDPQNWNIDPNLLAQELQSSTKMVGEDLVHTSSGRRVKAIMPVYTIGTPAEMFEIKSLAEKYSLAVVADAAAALGAHYRGESLAGLCDLSAFSFNGNKTVTAGAGGAIVGNNQRLLDLARHLSTTARRGPSYDHDMVGFNYRMTNLQGAVGCAQLENLEEFVAAKKRIRKTYDQGFFGLEGVRPFPQDDQSVCWFSGLIIDDPKLPQVADVCGALLNKDIEGRPFWKPAHLQTPYKEAPKTTMAITGDLWWKIITLPCSTNLTEVDQDKVITSVKEILRGRIQ